MTYDEAKAICTKAFDDAAKQGNANNRSLEARVVLMAAGDKKLTEALRIVAERNPPPKGTMP